MVADKIDFDSGEITELTELDTKGSAMFLAFLRAAPESEQQRIAQNMETFIAEFMRFRGLMPKTTQK